jgi:hypothetical protein
MIHCFQRMQAVYGHRGSNENKSVFAQYLLFQHCFMYAHYMYIQFLDKLDPCTHILLNVMMLSGTQ